MSVSENRQDEEGGTHAGCGHFSLRLLVQIAELDVCACGFFVCWFPCEESMVLKWFMSFQDIYAGKAGMIWHVVLAVRKIPGHGPH